ncbi:uncharacterized protein PSFLO_00028 [Pseudozyma flocculosa]|uniref:Uncharacterized protein n=1 Tax=Pseudozyma flocculosa TaxID=84751 RepID=A0A5C3ESS6_9BASI|nr:uncharacterized protein PSFLO_00028 [Pseudozyma flocculosa]
MTSSLGTGKAVRQGRLPPRLDFAAGLLCALAAGCDTAAPQPKWLAIIIAVVVVLGPRLLSPSPSSLTPPSPPCVLSCGRACCAEQRVAYPRSMHPRSLSLVIRIHTHGRMDFFELIVQAASLSTSKEPYVRMPAWMHHPACSGMDHPSESRSGTWGGLASEPASGQANTDERQARAWKRSSPSERTRDELAVPGPPAMTFWWKRVGGQAGQARQGPLRPCLRASAVNDVRRNPEHPSDGHGTRRSKNTAAAAAVAQAGAAAVAGGRPRRLGPSEPTAAANAICGG